MPLLRLLSKHQLLIVVFLTGAAVLVIEVAATRILSPYFGNTIFTVSSVISVILLALSVGYAWGGRLADKQGTHLLFYRLILFSGLSVLVLQLLRLLLLADLSHMLPLREGPLITSLLLFFMPGLLLGMLSPFVVKLQQERSKKGVGQTAGDVFFWSTLGSIAGSLITGFYLIPAFGLTEIILGVGLVLILIGVVGNLRDPEAAKSEKKVVVYLMLIVLLLLIVIAFLQKNAYTTVLYQQDGVYDSISIYEKTYKGKQTRFLQQSTDASSAMFVDSEDLVYDYTNYYAIYKLINPDIKRALVIGGGAYSVPKALYKDDADVVIDVAEIEPDLYSLGKRYFNVPASNRLRNHVEDGRRVLTQFDGKYNLIFADAFHTSIPPQLTTKEFFALSKKNLAQDGIFVMNIVGSIGETKPSFLFSELNTFQSIYLNYYVFAVGAPKEKYLQNIILVGVNGERKLSFNTADPFLSTLPQHRIFVSEEQLAGQTIFTDNYAPTEYFLGRETVE